MPLPPLCCKQSDEVPDEVECDERYPVLPIEHGAQVPSDFAQGVAQVVGHKVEAILQSEVKCLRGQVEECSFKCSQILSRLAMPMPPATSDPAPLYLSSGMSNPTLNFPASTKPMRASSRGLVVPGSPTSKPSWRGFDSNPSPTSQGPGKAIFARSLAKETESTHSGSFPLKAATKPATKAGSQEFEGEDTSSAANPPAPRALSQEQLLQTQRSRASSIMSPLAVVTAFSDFPALEERRSSVASTEPRSMHARSSYFSTFSALRQQVEDWEATPLQRTLHPIVFHPAFDRIFGVLIILNAACIGMEVEYRAHDWESSNVFPTLTLVFCLLFLIEFVLRTVAIGRRFFTRRDWGVFDFLMVVVSIIELFDTHDQARFLIRIARMVRLLRIVRVVKFSPQLQMMVFMIIESTRSLFSAMVLLTMILYMFSVCFTLAATEYRNSTGSDPSKIGNVDEHYGSVYKSAYACFKSITNGQAWGEIMEPLNAINPIYVGVFIFYISFSIFALMNVITGVFVDTALERSKTERDILVEKQLAMKRACVTNLKELFYEADSDNSGVVDFQEFCAALQNDKVKSYMHALSIDTSNLVDLFRQLDADRNGTITVDEFVDRCLHFMHAHNTEQYLWKIRDEIEQTREAIMKALSIERGAPPSVVIESVPLQARIMDEDGSEYLTEM